MFKNLVNDNNIKLEESFKQLTNYNKKKDWEKDDYRNIILYEFPFSPRSKYIDYKTLSQYDLSKNHPQYNYMYNATGKIIGYVYYGKYKPYSEVLEYNKLLNIDLDNYNKLHGLKKENKINT